MPRQTQRRPASAARPNRPARIAILASVAAVAAIGLGFPAAAQATPAAPAARAAQAAPAARAALRTPRPSVELPSLVDPIQPYVPQDSCDAVAKPGALALMALLLKTYPGSTNLGIAQTCAAEGMTSEHAEGRALDWGTSARTAAGRARANAMLSWLFADDMLGDQQVMARRLGVMYVIWNGQIREAGGGWETYLPGTCWTAGAHPRPKGDDTTCHRNHVHISLGWSGAWKRTSFWSGHVAPIDYGPCVANGRKRAAKYVAFNANPCGVRRGSAGSGGAGSGGSGGRPLPLPVPTAVLPTLPTPVVSSSAPAGPGPITFPVTGWPTASPDPTPTATAAASSTAQPG